MILILLMVYPIISQKTVNELGLMIGGGLFIATIALAALEGYKGMVISFLLNMSGLIVSILMFLNSNDHNHLIVGYFQMSIGISCLVIGLLSEKHTRMNAELRDMSNHDFTTNVYTHRFFHESIRTELTKSMDNNQPMSLILVDIDNFGRINQAFGYAAGDEVLKEIAKLIQQSVHSKDIVCRYGGNEFALILQNTSLEDALIISERIKSSVTHCAAETTKGKENISIDNLSVSIGISCFPDTASTSLELIEQMNSALQNSKNAGRNQVKIFRDVFMDIQEMQLEGLELEMSLKLILSTINAKDHYTSGHSIRVSEYVCKIGTLMGYGPDVLQELKIAALVHDIGKVNVSDYVLNKKGKLTEFEYKEIQQHVIYGKEILKDISGFNVYEGVVLYHHERYDGTGYPHQLIGDDIPLYARLISVADAFDAMISNRTYRKGMSTLEAIEELKRYSGKQFDPQFVDVLIQAVAPEAKLYEKVLFPFTQTSF